MRDAFINSINTQKTTHKWMTGVSDNLFNIYTPGYREKQTSFKTFLDGSVLTNVPESLEQGQSMPGVVPENLFLEGQGYFVLRNDEGRIAYTRYGDFRFDGEGIYRSADGQTVQGYILNEKGEIMNGAKAVDADDFIGTDFYGDVTSIPTTEISLWKDPENGKYLGKYEEFEVKDDGILYGKADDGKVRTPLYKIAVINFHNPQNLFEINDGQYIETNESGKPVIGKAEVRNDLLESSNVNFDRNFAYFQQAQIQMELANQMIKTYKQLLENAMELMKS